MSKQMIMFGADIGIVKATREICGMNLAYNIRRIAFLYNAKKILVIA